MTDSLSQGPGPITQLLERSAAGDTAAMGAVWELLHDELKSLARGRLAKESGPHTWQPTELVNEAWVKLCDLQMDLRNRTHFMAMAATAMRRALIDHARERRRVKRGSGARAVTLNTANIGGHAPQDVDILDLDRALSELATLDARKARAIELSYFGGLSDAEIADTTAVSESTVKRDLRSARAWLLSALADPA